MASSSSRASRSGQNSAPELQHGIRAAGGAIRPAHIDGRKPLRALELDRERAVFDGVLRALALERLERDALGGGRPPRPRGEFLRARRDRLLELRPGNDLVDQRHSTARLPLMPSSVVQNTSAWSRRTLRLSVTRVSPPVPGSTPSSGTSGSDTADEPSSISMMWSAASASS